MHGHARASERGHGLSINRFQFRCLGRDSYLGPSSVRHAQRSRSARGQLRAVGALDLPCAGSPRSGTLSDGQLYKPK